MLYFFQRGRPAGGRVPGPLAADSCPDLISYRFHPAMELARNRNLTDNANYSHLH
ncbi:MAG TPA: hypothetical protein VFT05_09765 [Burkholderiaceae bacterium]|nr:hypothetical protein [Burkholderiaceae bacterium]